MAYCEYKFDLDGHPFRYVGTAIVKYRYRPDRRDGRDDQIDIESLQIKETELCIVLDAHQELCLAVMDVLLERQRDQIEAACLEEARRLGER